MNNLITTMFPKKYFSTTKTLFSLYNIDSTIYKILSNTLTSKPINQDTQLEIERFLKNQYINSILDKKNLEKNKNIDFDRLNNKLLREITNSKELLIKLINNYKKDHLKHKK
uniref:DNA-directed RNA polymerase n=1 Tax=Clavaria fumosa TaxID=264083 RepID=A0A7T3PCR3_9AGAR|nr:DNA-directed RNA polymerase [Clavaria fumosa]QPZ51119.1 DNA-directed RNA polymerase [Clavaria fumosa]